MTNPDVIYKVAVASSNLDIIAIIISAIGVLFSAGLSEPFSLPRQYKKNTGTEIDVLLTNGNKLIGKLTVADDQGFDLEVTTKEKIEGSKKKELVTKVHHFEYSEIKEAKKILKF